MSMSKETNTTSSGIGFSGLLTITFIVLKLTKYINWSWWWVLSPLWISTLIVIIFLLLYLSITLITTYYKRKKRNKNKINTNVPKTGFMKRLEEAEHIRQEVLNKRLQSKNK